MTINENQAMKILDLYCGLGGWSQPFKTHDITGIDIANFSPNYPGKFIKADLLQYTPAGNFDIIMASPPCEDFSKSTFPKTWASVVKYPPNLTRAQLLFNRAREIISQKKPKFWIIENVRGAQKYVGKADFHTGSRYFWSNLRFSVNNPIRDEIYGKTYLSPSPDRPQRRALIPQSIAEAFKNAVEKAIREATE
jgi:hypothetical protein